MLHALALSLFVTATPPAAPAPRSELSALIYAGGSTQAEGQRWLDDWTRVGKKLGTPDLAAGFPKLVASETIAGLKPGFFIVLLGFCPDDKSADVLDELKAFYAGVYTRAVRGQAEACPRLGNVQHTLVGTIKLANGSMSAVSTVVNDVEDADSLDFILRDPQGFLLDTLAKPAAWHLNDTGHSSCKASTTISKKRFVVDHECETGSYLGWISATDTRLEYTEPKHAQMERYDQ